MQKKQLVFGSILGGSVLLVGIIFSLLYSTIHKTVFPYLPEAEVQTYILSIVVWIVLFSCIYWIFHARQLKNISFQLTNKFRFPFRIFLLSVISVSFVFLVILFTRIFYFDADPHVLLQEMGFSPSSYNPILLSVLFGFFYIVLPFLVAQKKQSIRPLFLRFIPFVCIILFIIVLTFRVGYLSIYDFTHYAGPVYDILSGLPPLSSVSYYGFLSTVALAKIFTFIPLTLINLHIVFAVFVTLGFILYYLLSFLLFRSHYFALLITLFGISANWLTGIVPVGSSPQTTVFRFGLWMILAYAIYQQSKANGRQKFVHYFITYLVLVLSVFWAFDSGMYMVIAYVIQGYILSLKMTLLATVKTFITYILPIVYSFLVGFISIQTLYYFNYGVVPNWNNFLSPSFSFISSSLLIPLPHTIIPWILLAPSVMYICFFLAKYYTRSYHEVSAKEKTIHFVAWYGIIQFVYFIGRSHPNNLHHIILPTIVCFFALIEQVERRIRRSRQFSNMVIHLCIAMTIAYPLTFLTVQSYLNVHQENFITSIQTIRAPRGTEKDNFGQTTHVIQEKYQQYIASDAVGILALYDTWYLILLHAKNRIGSNCMFCIHDDSSYKKIVDTIRTNPPTYIFVDINYSSYIGSFYDQISHIFPYIQDLYVYKETLGLLDIYKRRY